MLKQITENIYCMNYKENKSIIGLVMGKNNSLMIDAGASKEQVDEFLEAISDLSVPPIKYLVLTHSHLNHSCGAKHLNLINIVNGMTCEKLKKFSEEQGVNIKADIIYDEFLKLDLGDMIIELERIPSDHTRDCSVVHIPSEKVVFVGDALYSNKKEKEPSYTRELMIPLLKELQCYEAAYYITSHEFIYTNKEFEEYSNRLIAIGKVMKDIYTFEDGVEKVQKNLNLDEFNITDVKKNIKAFVNGNNKNRH